MTDGGDSLSWARGVVDLGWPGQGLSIAAMVEAYAELAVAYHLLAEDAAEYGHMDRYKEYNELAVQALKLMDAPMGEEERRW